ncbi:uncharacterized protein LOC143301136 [Babylonia areolata]|uniref:uncharacterized protein LOC143301136 n=1 Tax=Babylonia areolata TaxID=304850 RepID=UPI003FD12541
MGRNWFVLLIAGSMFVLSTSASRLHCFFGNEFCTQLEVKYPLSYQRNYKGELYCCPPHQNQDMNLTDYPPTPDCACACMEPQKTMPCLFGNICDHYWNYNGEDGLEYGTYDSLKYCCPPHPYQSAVLNSFPPTPYGCVCSVGNAEEYANLTQIAEELGPNTPGANAATTLTSQYMITVTLLFAAVLLH